jgi:hypothetical protein
MRQHEIVIGMEQRQLLLYTVLALAQRIHPTPHRRYTLTDVEVQSLDRGGIDLPATRQKDLLNPSHGAKHHAVSHPHEAPTPIGFHHLSIQELG